MDFILVLMCLCGIAVGIFALVPVAEREGELSVIVDEIDGDLSDVEADVSELLEKVAVLEGQLATMQAQVSVPGKGTYTADEFDRFVREVFNGADDEV